MFHIKMLIKTLNIGAIINSNMRCPNCGKDIEKGWNYCPNCGARFRRDFFSSLFDRMFSRMDRELGEMNRLMEKNIEALDISPFFRQMEEMKPRGSGFSIRIRGIGGSPPRVSVRTFGDVDRGKVREQIKRQLGTLGFEREEKPIGYVKKPLGMERIKQLQESLTGEPKSVEEPRTDVKRLGNRVVVDLEMPGVKSLDDINIRELESSLEVKATAGDKAYFKILTKPGQFRLTNRSFSRGVLHLEFS